MEDGDVSEQTFASQDGPEWNRYSAYGFRGPQVCSIVGITYRQLDYWARTKVIEPSLVGAAGSGSQRLYSWRDLIAFQAAHMLLQSGLKLAHVRNVIRTIHETEHDYNSGFLFCDHNGSAQVATADSIVQYLETASGANFFVAMRGLAAAISTAIEKQKTQPVVVKTAARLSPVV